MLDCVVVGAGLAGLSAALELVGRGKQVVVLEARERVGGRVESVLHDDQVIELGGQWLSPGNDAMLDLVQQAGLELTGPADGVLLIRSQGTVYRSEQAPDRGPSLSPFEMADLGQGVLRFRRLADRVVNDGAWALANGVWLAQPLIRWVKANLRTPAAQEAFGSVLRAAQGDGIEHPTLSQALAMNTNGTDLESLFAVSGGLQQRRVVGGLAQVGAYMAAQLGESLRLGTVVTRIEHDEHSVVVHTAGGDAFPARAVLVALPPWLGQRLEYDPPLPSWREDVVRRTSPGNVIKAMVIYSEPWWRASGLSGQMSADEGHVRVTFDVSDPDGPGVLTGFFEGIEAVTLSKRTSTLRERAFVDDLAAVFGDDAHRPHVYIDRDWAAEEFSRGCHGAHFSPGVWSVNGQLLAEPQGLVHFAGAEYAARFNGYLEGAVRSGRDEARAILRELA
ncbi:FAD-dependent oxidoreductase [Brooklawnia cerclae]|uniref:Monoamine oxidase n=1 Tax=Brooklawnia cerclae TaxID=349934 RepID=A0ABX0SAW9_9ACTN|nr:monoamine oxidase [Brooklawnia cerclae]